MYLSSYKRVCELFNTIYEGILYCQSSNEVGNIVVLKDCIEGMEVIKATIEGEKNAKAVETVCAVDSIIGELSKVLGNIDKLEEGYYNRLLELLENTFNHMQQTTDVKLKIAFLPYKAAMWTALESVWKAAEKDPDCTAVVMPIPYVEAGNEKVIYEGDMFPEHVPITNYESYNLEDEKPDIIYIHNPYDHTNKITSVLPTYFSENLAKVTDMLVYIPYFIFGLHNNINREYSSLHYRAYATRNVNKIIAQSNRVKELYERYGQRPDKVVALGSPKSDAIIKSMQNPSIIPREWNNKIEGKKVFLFNTHITNIPKYGELAIEGIEMILDTVINKENCALIWRPHPLTDTMLRTYSPQYCEKFNEMKKRVLESNNGIIDSMGSYLPAFSASHAMISTYSSLVQEYMITEKPILIAQQKRNPDNFINSPVDIFCNYFLSKEKKEVQEFVEMVIRGEDPKKDERIQSIKNGLLNLDGTCGEKIHEYIKLASIQQL